MNKKLKQDSTVKMSHSMAIRALQTLFVCHVFFFNLFAASTKVLQILQIIISL